MVAQPLQHSEENEVCTNVSFNTLGSPGRDSRAASEAAANRRVPSRHHKQRAQDSPVVNSEVYLLSPLQQHSLSLPLPEHCLHPSPLGYMIGRFISINLRGGCCKLTSKSASDCFQ